MPSSAVLTYADPSAYARDMPGLGVELHATAAGEFKANTTTISLHHLSVGRFADNLPRVMHAAPAPGRALMAFKLNAGPELVWDGLLMQPSTILQHNSDSSYFQRSSGEARWASMSLPLETLEGSLTDLSGRDLRGASHAATVVPSSLSMRKLQRLHAACCDMARHGPELLANLDAAKGIEQALLETLAACLGTGAAHPQIASSRQSARIMRRFPRFVEENADRAIYIGEINMAIGVSGRVLRSCCNEYLGMGASQYLALRRMHLVRASLCANSPATSTVTEAATFYGFWELGRFSVNYKALFAEHPIQTLRRDPVDIASMSEPIIATTSGGVVFN